MLGANDLNNTATTINGGVDSPPRSKRQQQQQQQQREKSSHSNSKTANNNNVITVDAFDTGTYGFNNEFFQFVGATKNGIPQGHGVLYFSDGGSIEGCFVKGEMHGEGIRRWPDGSTYIGQLRRGERYGLGRHVSADGEEYTGNFQYGQRSGHGVLVNYATKTRYEGCFAGHLYDGFGLLVTQPLQARGEFKAGKIHGSVECAHSNGDVFVGRAKCGLPEHADRFYSAATGIVYCGDMDSSLDGARKEVPNGIFLQEIRLIDDHAPTSRKIGSASAVKKSTPATLGGFGGAKDIEAAFSSGALGPSVLLHQLKQGDKHVTIPLGSTFVLVVQLCSERRYEETQLIPAPAQCPQGNVGGGGAGSSTKEGGGRLLGGGHLTRKKSVLTKILRHEVTPHLSETGREVVMEGFLLDATYDQTKRYSVESGDRQLEFMSEIPPAKERNAKLPRTKPTEMPPEQSSSPTTTVTKQQQQRSGANNSSNINSGQKGGGGVDVFSTNTSFALDPAAVGGVSNSIPSCFAGIPHAKILKQHLESGTAVFHVALLSTEPMDLVLRFRVDHQLGVQLVPGVSKIETLPPLVYHLPIHVVRQC